MFELQKKDNGKNTLRVGCCTKKIVTSPRGGAAGGAVGGE